MVDPEITCAALCCLDPLKALWSREGWEGHTWEKMASLVWPLREMVWRPQQSKVVATLRWARTPEELGQTWFQSHCTSTSCTSEGARWTWSSASWSFLDNSVSQGGYLQWPEAQRQLRTANENWQRPLDLAVVATVFNGTVFNGNCFESTLKVQSQIRLGLLSY